MKAVVHDRPGPAGVLRVVERDIPTPGPGEVRVRVIISAVNPTDWKSRAGMSRVAAAEAAEVTPNQDGAGVIDAVGPGVDGVRPGDRVWIYLAAHERPTGTAQEYTVLPADRVVRLPDAASFEVGASLGVPAMTAHRALTVAEDGPGRLAHDAVEAGVTGKVLIEVAVPD